MSQFQPPESRDFPFAIWLCPDDKSGKRLQPLLEAFEPLGVGAGFPPHITLASGRCPDLQAVGLDQNARVPECLPLELLPKSLDRGDSFFQSVYLTFARHDLLESLHAFFCQLLDKPLRWLPHLSLVYGDISRQAKQQVIQNLPLPKEPLRFNRIECWAPRPGFTWHHINQWQRVSLIRESQSSDGGV